MPRGAKSKAAAAAPSSGPPDAGMVALHRSRFVEWQPSAVLSLASSGDGSLAAAARENGDIELYDTTTGLCLQRVPGSTHAAPTCVALVDEDAGAAARLFTAGLDGVVVELDPETGRPAAAATDSYGGAVWAMAPEPRAALAEGASPRLAVACDDGCVRLFSVEPGQPGAAYAKSLPRVEGRALAVAWHPSGACLASAGTDGCIHVWAPASGRETLRITAGDATARAADAAVWALLFLPDGTLVSGDSSGNVQFWDARFGTLLARFSVHSADVLCLAASPDGGLVFAAGVDPQLAVFRRVPGAGDGGSAAGGPPRPPWAFLSAKRSHSHDVRALCVVSGRHAPEPRLLSAGNDTQLLSHSVPRFLKEHPARLNPVPQRPRLAAARAGGAAEGRVPWLLCAQRDAADIWQLGTANALQAAVTGAGAAEGAAVGAAASPQHLARIVSRPGAFLTAAAVSADGRHVALSDATRVLCFGLEELPGDEELGVPHLGITPLPLPAGLPPARALAFRPGAAAQLVACAADGTISVVDLEAAAAAGGEAGGGTGGSGKKGARGKAAAAAAAAENGAGGGAPLPVVHTIRDIHDLRYKIWAKRDRGRSAARWAAPALELSALSPDGSWLALAARQRLHLLDLRTLKLAPVTLGPLPEHRPVTALAFTADSAAVVVATSGAQLAAFDVATGQPTTWTAAHSEAVAARLAELPGAVVGISSNPASPTSLVLHTPEAVCHLDIGKPLRREAPQKRRRSKGKPVPASSPAGENGRVLRCSDPVLHSEFIGPDSLLVVERSWADVWEKLAPPVYRHRYGT